MSATTCFARSAIRQLCAAIVDGLIRGKSICQDEVFEDVSCINDAVEQLLDQLSIDDNKLPLTELRALISNQLSFDHHRIVREEDHHDDDDHDDHDKDDDHDDHNEVQTIQNVSLYLVWLYRALQSLM